MWLWLLWCMMLLTLLSDILVSWLHRCNNSETQACSSEIGTAIARPYHWLTGCRSTRSLTSSRLSGIAMWISLELKWSRCLSSAQCIVWCFLWPETCRSFILQMTSRWFLCIVCGIVCLDFDCSCVTPTKSQVARTSCKSVCLAQ